MQRRHPGPHPEPDSSAPAESKDGSRPTPEAWSSAAEFDGSGPDDIAPDVTGGDGSEEAIDDDPELPGDETDDPSQPIQPNGVGKGMASVVLDQRSFESSRAGQNLDPLAGGSSGPLGSAAQTGAMTDADIMLRVRDGDDSGFTYLIEKYRKPILHFMFRMVRNQAIAEELAQEVFLRVYRSRQSYRAEAQFSTWLYRIATNLGVNHARDNKHEKAAQNVYLDQPDDETGNKPDVADPHATVEQDLVRDERMLAIRQQVMALPERQRSAVLMHKYQGLGYKEIGQVLKLSESATKSLLFRAYQTLRESLKEFAEHNWDAQRN